MEKKDHPMVHDRFEKGRAEKAERSRIGTVSKNPIRSNKIGKSDAKEQTRAASEI